MTLAAIKGLYERTETQGVAIRSLRSTVHGLRTRLATQRRRLSEQGHRLAHLQREMARLLNTVGP